MRCFRQYRNTVVLRAGIVLVCAFAQSACTSGTIAGPDYADTFGPMDPGTTGGGTSGSGDPGTDDDTGSPTTGGVDDPDQAMRALVRARCDWFFGCCNTGELELLVGPFTGDAADCTDRVMDALAAGNTEPPIVNGASDRFLYTLFAANTDRAVLNDAAVSECLDQLENQDCNAATEPASCGAPLGADGDRCSAASLFVGTQGPGEACNPALRYECADGLGCIDLGGSGICVERAAEGETCFASLECATGLACELQSGTCAQPSALGEACSYADPSTPIPGTEATPCAEGLGCDATSNTCVGPCQEWSPCQVDGDCPDDLACRAGACQGPLTWAGPCETGEDCASGECIEETSRCSPLVANGNYCTSADECASGWCDPTTSLCTATVSLGGACPSGNHAECGPGSACVGSVCSAPPGPGEACHPTTNPCSDDAYCSTGFCLGLPLPNGSACGENGQCASGLCQSTCKATATLGDECGTAGALKCGADLYCDLDPVTATGSCQFVLETGEPCLNDAQCRGACVVAWGRQMCDATPPAGAAWCDGG